jgi:hypothetical protein
VRETRSSSSMIKMWAVAIKILIRNNLPLPGLLASREFYHADD